MKELIHEILKRYTGKGANLDSLALREMIADELYDEINTKYTVNVKLIGHDMGGNYTYPENL